MEPAAAGAGQHRPRISVRATQRQSGTALLPFLGILSMVMIFKMVLPFYNFQAETVYVLWTRLI